MTMNLTMEQACDISDKIKHAICEHVEKKERLSAPVERMQIVLDMYLTQLINMGVIEDSEVIKDYRKDYWSMDKEGVEEFMHEGGFLDKKYIKQWGKDVKKGDFEN